VVQDSFLARRGIATIANSIPGTVSGQRVLNNRPIANLALTGPGGFYRYGYGFSPYSYPYGYGGYPWGIVASSILFGLPYFAYHPVCGYGYGYGGTSSGNYAYQSTTLSNPVPPSPPPPPSEAANLAAVDFVAQGEAAFKAGNYEAAVRAWRHALVDDPQNGVLVLMLAQALFATGKYDEAAGAVQFAMQLLPEDKWGVVVSNYAELYRGNQDYTNQLRALEAARDKSDSPAARFLLGYHYGYLGYPKQAIRELDKALELAPQDEMAKKLHALLSAKLSPSATPAPAPPPKE
jgi:Tfp pilus assembly protein PilF